MRFTARTLLVSASLLIVTAGSSAAQAQTTVYTGQPGFNAATTALTTYGFSFPTTGITLSSPYVRGPVTFSTAGSLIGFNDGHYGASSYLADDRFNAGGPVYTISSTTTALGLSLGSYFGLASYSYVVNGVAGSIAVPGTTFLGFTSNSPISVAFTLPAGTELDVTGFVTASAAVPEPATWGLLMLGFAGIGWAMRRRRVMTRVAYG